MARPAPDAAQRPAAGPPSGATLARRALVLQGGGALGAYQGGVYEALRAYIDAQAQAHTPVPPLDWVAGVSIGAINAALIAGNAPEQRVAKLREFWDLVSSGPGQSLPQGLSRHLPDWAGGRRWLNQWSAASAVVAGIPGFFEPRCNPALALGDDAPLLSYYDTAPLKATLERLVDFDRINAPDAMRFSVGAVNVRSGNSKYFDNRGKDKVVIRAEHILASGALPPGFAPVHIDGEDYWDGGILSNTPLQYVLDEHAHACRDALLVWQVDLFSASGALPRTLGEVQARREDIQFSSRTRMNTNALADNLNLHESLVELLDSLPTAQQDNPAVVHLRGQLRREPIDIVHLIRRPHAQELDSRTYEFSRLNVQAHWEAGRRDLERTVLHPDWMRGVSHAGGVTTWDLCEAGVPKVRHRKALA